MELPKVLPKVTPQFVVNNRTLAPIARRGRIKQGPSGAMAKQKNLQSPLEQERKRAVEIAFDATGKETVEFSGFSTLKSLPPLSPETIEVKLVNCPQILNWSFLLEPSGNFHNPVNAMDILTNAANDGSPTAAFMLGWLTLAGNTSLSISEGKQFLELSIVNANAANWFLPVQTKVLIKSANDLLAQIPKDNLEESKLVELSKASITDYESTISLESEMSFHG